MLRPKELISSFSGTATSCHMLMHFILYFYHVEEGNKSISIELFSFANNTFASS